MGFEASRRDPALGDVLKAALGFGGLAMCLTLEFLGMRAVMDVGGSCADGGPYVSAQSCPDAAVAAVPLGIFGLLLFGAIAMVYGSRLGGIWGAVPFLGWTALFGSLGWNFLDYGLFNPPPEFGVEWGWIFCGVTFEVMAFGPLLLAIPGIRAARRSRGGPAVMVRPVPMRGPGMAQATRVATPSSSGVSTVATRATAAAERAALQDIATVMGVAVSAAVAETAASTPVDPLARAAASLDAGIGEGADAGVDFQEGTQALLDRLERLGDMRDRGLLTHAEFEAAKAAVITELEARS
ncbi:MAG: SHOCT domain-containing protein [Candidatus Limnocylindrales bacterium]